MRQRDKHLRRVGRKSRSRKTAKRLEIKRKMLEALALKRSRNIHK